MRCPYFNWKYKSTLSVLNSLVCLWEGNDCDTRIVLLSMMLKQPPRHAP